MLRKINSSREEKSSEVGKCFLSSSTSRSLQIIAAEVGGGAGAWRIETEQIAEEWEDEP